MSLEQEGLDCCTKFDVPFDSFETFNEPPIFPIPRKNRLRLGGRSVKFATGFERIQGCLQYSNGSLP